MTTEEASVLMNKYFDNDATDDELKALFLDLGRSDEHRALFAKLKLVNDALLAPPDAGYPPSIDRALSALTIRDEAAPQTLEPAMIASLPSALLSGFTAFLLAVVLFFMATKAVSTPQAYDRESVMLEYYGGSRPASHSFNQ